MLDPSLNWVILFVTWSLAVNLKTAIPFWNIRRCQTCQNTVVTVAAQVHLVRLFHRQQFLTLQRHGRTFKKHCSSRELHLPLSTTVHIRFLQVTKSSSLQSVFCFVVTWTLFGVCYYKTFFCSQTGYTLQTSSFMPKRIKWLLNEYESLKINFMK